MRTRDYRILLPKDITIKVACEQARCDNWLYGFDVLLDTSTAEGLDAAEWFRSGKSGRTYRELPGVADGGMTVFRFEPHQRCFEEHRTRPARWLAAHRECSGMPAWIQDLDDHVGGLKEQLQKG